MNVDIILHFNVMSHQNVSMLIGESQARQCKLDIAYFLNTKFLVDKDINWQSS